MKPSSCTARRDFSHSFAAETPQIGLFIHYAWLNSLIVNCMRLFLSIGIVVLSTAMASAATVNCGSRDIRTVLADQGFTGVLTGGDALERLGSWAGSHSSYTVYWYEHVDRARRAGHAVRSVVVMARNCRYLGRYSVNPTQPHVQGRVIYFTDVSASKGNKIVLNADGRPPKKIWIDGENPELAK